MIALPIIINTIIIIGYYINGYAIHIVIIVYVYLVMVSMHAWFRLYFISLAMVCSYYSLLYLFVAREHYQCSNALFVRIYHLHGCPWSFQKQVK